MEVLREEITERIKMQEYFPVSERHILEMENA
jgi:hypothetical protein